MSVELHLYVILYVLVPLCPLIKLFQTFKMEAVARLWNNLSLLRRCPAVVSVYNKKKASKTELGKVCFVKMDLKNNCNFKVDFY